MHGNDEELGGFFKLVAPEQRRTGSHGVVQFAKLPDCAVPPSAGSMSCGLLLFRFGVVAPALAIKWREATEQSRKLSILVSICMHSHSKGIAAPLRTSLPPY